MRTHTDPRCTGCTQDLLRDCREALAVTPQRPCLVRTVATLAGPSQKVGIKIETVVHLLRAGVPIAAVVNLIQSRLLNRTTRAA